MRTRVGAAGDGVTYRIIADLSLAEVEARFYPYFFPDIFNDGGNPVKESIPVWIKWQVKVFALHVMKPMEMLWIAEWYKHK